MGSVAVSRDPQGCHRDLLTPREKAIHHETPVLVVGAGPSGLIAAQQFAKQGTKCMLVERNLDTTKWPKMDITNCRSMELFSRLDIADRLREQGVGQDYSFDVIFSNGLSPGGDILGKWSLPSANQWRKMIKSQNDGSMPREPYQRCSQAVFEAWLKPLIQEEPLIDSHFGLKFESLTESDAGVESKLIDQVTGEVHIIHSQYVVGCDGAGSRVRKSVGIDMIGGPVPVAMFLIHFKSRDLDNLHRQGRFWHVFLSNGAGLISQDEEDTWTIHVPVSIDTDPTTLNAEEAVSRAIGGDIGPCPIKIDKVLVQNIWRPNIYIANRYSSEGGRVFITGDAAHQNIPTGGYGMNTAVGDSFDIGWKIAAIINGYGGKHLLDSYVIERKPVAVRNIERSGVHFSVHRQYVQWVQEAGPGMSTDQTEKGRELRERIKRHLDDRDGENKEHGIELGYRYNDSPVIVPDTTCQEPEWSYRSYIPSTWPGARAPHVWLADGKTSIFDLFGPGYTIIDFSAAGQTAAKFAAVSKELGIPLKMLHLPEEHHARKVWERDFVLIRPDDHVAWRSSGLEPNTSEVERILKIAAGQESSNPTPNHDNANGDDVSSILERGFSGTVGNVEQDKVEALGAFQK